jgi:hypothetical protein
MFIKLLQISFLLHVSSYGLSYDSVADNSIQLSSRSLPSFPVNATYGWVKSFTDSGCTSVTHVSHHLLDTCFTFVSRRRRLQSSGDIESEMYTCGTLNKFLFNFF